MKVDETEKPVVATEAQQEVQAPISPPAAVIEEKPAETTSAQE